MGLAAPQVGVNVRMMVFNEFGERDKKEGEVVLVNPRIITLSKDTSVFEEGCLSFPKIYGNVVVCDLPFQYSFSVYFDFKMHLF